ncbi:undecaprenyldiphospho-muramoylpentapeptide beta-N-acetylglucosaminyltransferase [candidate division NPL-UPA2 bacterium]|nr:undecaprenyldiphospho-muramoylpentapeptide beta-N-acetylglucosaminyltransferase [candidate division NPL-UPA2 bacterium]
MTLKVVIVAGGTGGHLFPGLAVARKLREKEKDSEVIFIGRKKGWEAEIVPREGFKFISISAGGWLGKSPVRRICSIMEALAGFFQSFFILRRLHPGMVMGMGGYVAGPFVLAASLLGFPTIIHEQNLVPGFTNRILSRFVNEIELSFPESSRFFPRGRVRVTGNPVREEIWRTRGSGRKSKSKRTLLVMGGSRGAHRINLVLAEAIRSLKGKMSSWQIIHLSGREDCDLMVRTYKKAEMEAVVYPFLHCMEEAYQEADLVVARAGATTVAEIMACGLPAILIPYSLATEHHQEENARWLERKGAAITIRERELTGERLAETILSLMVDEERLSWMAESSKGLSRPEAAEAVVARVITLARRKKLIH